MIGSLTGVLTFKSPPHLLLDVGGVGYELEAPNSTFDGLPAAGERLTLLTHLVVREDAHILYGFASAAERTLFRSLLKVSGVGPRIALAILSGVSAHVFAQAVREQDASVLTRVSGVGRKIAERLIIEMRDRIEQQDAMMPLGGFSAGQPVTAAHGPEAEAFSALVALGYKPHEASRMLKTVQVETGTLTAEELLRRSLQSVVRV